MIKSLFTRTAAVVLLCAGAAFATNFNGRWTGTFLKNGSNPREIAFDLRQTGNTVAGTVIIKGDVAPVEGEVFKNTVLLKGHFKNEVFRIEMVLTGPAMTGRAWSRKGSGSEDGPIPIAVTRAGIVPPR